MALQIDWGTRVITVQQADLLQVQSTPIEVYELNLSDFHDELRDIEDDALGMPHPDTHDYQSPTTISGVTLALVVEMINNYTVTFLPDSPWAVNIVGGNSNVADVVNPNNVSVRTANSAGLQDAESLQAASFSGQVALDVVNGVAGTTFPRGTRQTPVNNLADAKIIADQRGIPEIVVFESMIISGIDMSDGYTFTSDNPGLVTVTIDPSADVSNARFHQLTLQGTMDIGNSCADCTILNLTNVSGSLTDCGLEGSITLAAGTKTSMIDCHSEFAGAGPGQAAVVDMGGTADLVVRDYLGGLSLSNHSDGDVSLDVASGRIVVESTVTAGTITIRGVAEVTDESTGTAVVDDQTVTVAVDFVQKLLRNRRETDPVTGVQRIFDDDDTTILVQGDLWEDIAGTQGYQGSGADRADRLV